MKLYDVQYYDVLRDNVGWSFNGAVVQRTQLQVEDHWSERTIERKARELFAFTGRKTLREDWHDGVRWVDTRNAVAVELTFDTDRG
jgi:hypothetical protein